LHVILGMEALTIEEINLMPMGALTLRDFVNMQSTRLPYSNYSYLQASSGFPKDERERILAKFGNENDARWYWIWIRRGLDPEKSLRKVCSDDIMSKQQVRRTKVTMARNKRKRMTQKPIEVLLAHPSCQSRHQIFSCGRE
jgi:hypothetical protein